METILVTGGMGFIGSAVVRMALAEGFHVVNIDCLTYAANPENVAEAMPSDNYIFVQANICDAAQMARVFKEHKPGVILHLAAESHVDRSIDAADAFITTNINGTHVLLETARNYWSSLTAGAKNNFRFLHVSTDEVYGDLGPEDAAFSETTPYNPSSPYSASKAASDHLVRAWHRTYGLPTLITNCSNNYGPYQFPEKLIPVVIHKILRRETIPVYGSGANIRDWLYVDDHAAALLAALKNGKPGETYNIGGNSEVSNIDLVKMICAVMDAKDPGDKPHTELITFVTDRPGHDRRYAINASKIKHALGWEPATNLKSGLEKTITWYLANRHIWEPLLSGQKDRIGLGKGQS